MASRTGVMEVPRSAASAEMRSRSPGSNCPSDQRPADAAVDAGRKIFRLDLPQLGHGIQCF